MKRSNIMKLRIKPIVAACALAMAAGQAGAIDYYLAAKQYDKVLMPGTPLETTVPMWGYVIDPDNGANNVGDCYEAGDAAARQLCVDGLPDPAVPGPQLSMPSTDNQLRIFLSNGLPEATSIVIPGQELPWSNNNNGPTFVRPNGTLRIGNRNGMNQKMRSYGREAAANGGIRSYRWTNFRANPINETGTFIYHTGTHPQKQLYMGLFGAVTKDFIPGEVYEGVPYASDTTLFYSDIDPAFNAAVVAGTLETAIERHPSWFLINGEPYVPGTTPDILGMATNQPNLIRFASATTEKHVPVLQGLYGTIHGEDGIQYNWQDSVANTTTPAPIQQYSIGLPPLKTKDVIVNPAAADRYAIYDGNGYMTNPSDPDNEAVGDTTGGMLRFISFTQGANQPPVTVADQVEISIPELAAGAVSVDVDVLINDSDPEGAALGVLDTVDQFVGTNLVIDWTCSSTTDNCTAVATATDPWTSPVVNDFAYTATDSNAATTDTAGTVTVTVVQNMAPVPADDTLAAVTDAPINFNLYTDLVLPNDTDAEDTLSVTAVDVNAATDLDAGVVSCPDLVLGDCTYTPPDPLPATIPFDKTFTYTVSDGVNPDSAPVTVTINVDLPGDPAIANDDPLYATDEDTILNVDALTGVLANDTDSASGPLAGTETAVLVAGSGPSNAANFVLNSDGSFDYEPFVDFNGTDSFQYVVNNGVDSLPATVTITVNPVADPPVAVADSFVMAQNAVLDEAAPGVLVNDTDPEDDPLTAVLVSGPSCAWTTGPNGANAFVLNADGSFHYEPIPGWNSTLPDTNTICPGVTGDDSFTYVANDGVDDSATAVTVTISVNPQTAPTAVNDTFILDTPVDTIFTFEGELVNALYEIPAPGVLDNDTYIPPQTLTEVNDPDNLTPSLADDGTINFEIDNIDTGIIATLEYQITDDTGATSNIAQVDLVRQIAVEKAGFNLNEDGGIEVGGNPANDDWRIEGTVDPTVIPLGTEIYAFIIREGVVDPIPINTPADIDGNNDNGTVFDENSWRILINDVGIDGPRGDSPPVNGVSDKIRIEAHVVNPDTSITVITYNNVTISVVD
ncbi:Ig-like domain-containing protein [Candidatus Thiodiazotropha sp. CDECU1]|uniref:Ig-like domain-containing protein n=1 Tax=Candidatus Thiodiazotropha sp. CDECU1 TaxID=3065865 RepID=UPI00292E7326|nr:Ig-like domain-containing protein [Candidatus Thiodiazotropha sp. CDECU1]